jgi:hypothetical protein
MFGCTSSKVSRGKADVFPRRGIGQDSVAAKQRRLNGGRSGAWASATHFAAGAWGEQLFITWARWCKWVSVTMSHVVLYIIYIELNRSAVGTWDRSRSTF